MDVKVARVFSINEPLGTHRSALSCLQAREKARKTLLAQFWLVIKMVRVFSNQPMSAEEASLLLLHSILFSPQPLGSQDKCNTRDHGRKRSSNSQRSARVTR